MVNFLLGSLYQSKQQQTKNNQRCQGSYCQLPSFKEDMPELVNNQTCTISQSTLVTNSQPSPLAIPISRWIAPMAAKQGAHNKLKSKGVGGYWGVIASQHLPDLCTGFRNPTLAVQNPKSPDDIFFCHQSCNGRHGTSPSAPA